MEISVIVPVFNKISIVKECIKLNIDHCQKPCEWIIIDNNSDSDTKAGIQELKTEAESRAHKFVIVTETENTGVARAWNKGLTLAGNEYVCILNNDCVMMPGWDREMIIQNDKNNLQISTPFVLEPWMFKKSYGLSDFLISTLNWEYLSEKNKNRVRPGVFTGVVFFGKKQYFTEVGAFDESFWLSLEEYDYLLRAREIGQRTGVIGAVTAFHFGGITRNEMKTDGGTHNQNYFEKKWGWNFEKVETAYPNKQIKSIQKFVFRHFQILSTFNFVFPQKK